MSEPNDVKTKRKKVHSVDDTFIFRWSPRAMSGGEISDKELFTLFEAARWAPSSYNGQPWRFFYAKRKTPQWDTFYNLMVDFNKQWTVNAAVLVVIVSKKTYEHNGKPNNTHSFDTGAAWANFALQGSMMGLVVHGMSGFNYQKAHEALNLSDEYQVEAMAAVGKPGKPENLPDDIRKMESPSGRNDFDKFVYEGGL